MEAISQYVISVTTASILCGIVGVLIKTSPSHNIIKLLCGTFLIFTFLRPISELPIGEYDRYILPDLELGKATVRQGEEMSREAMAAIITQKTEAYVLDKAEELGASVLVEVALSDDPVSVPVSMRISGSVSPYVREQLRQYILKDLGIHGEDLHWIG